jgi:hypothetical protein
MDSPHRERIKELHNPPSLFQNDKRNACMTAQECSSCKESKPASEFHRDCNKPDGLRGRCRSCESVAGQVRRQSRHKTLEPTVESKKCRRCEQTKRGKCVPST